MTLDRYSFWLGAGTMGPGEPAEGIRRLDLDRAGQPTLHEPIFAGPNPTFLAALENGVLAVAHEMSDGQVSVLDPDSGALSAPAATFAADPCYVAAQADTTGTRLCVANYSGGTLTVHTVVEGRVGEPDLVVAYEGRGPRDDRQSSPHPHQTVIDEAHGVLLVPDLGMDVIHVHELSALFAGDADHRDIMLPPATGPRHLVVDGDTMLVAGELSRTVTAVDYETGEVIAVASSTLGSGEDDEEGPSAIRLTRAGHVIVANRSPHTIGVLEWDAAQRRLDFLEEYHCGGVHPRDMELSRDERFLVVANQWSDHLTVFEYDPLRGDLRRVAGIDTPSPECLLRF